MNNKLQLIKPSTPFVGASWGALAIGIACFLLGLWNATMQLNEKGFYLAVLLLGLYAAISIQKSVRDKAEGINVTGIYIVVSWFALAASIALLIIGLINADLALSEKGFYGISFILSLFSVVVVQKNTRDSINSGGDSAVEDSRKISL
ncbi:inner membrane protein YiaA [Reinekea sp. G2M2-21]|uniref:inner membrane protein YiaA n=1 Tax=Reinekea sp. G2M2-21 TaxID=2788942 RepID=UPI0018AA06D5|nr:inner membrane protein YiaA [Reinekea sp. G2M2-21]